VSNVTRIAGRLPLHASSSGLVLLAYAPRELQHGVLSGPLPALTASTITDPDELRAMLDRVRRIGYAEAPAAVEAISTGIAVPVRADPRPSAPVLAALGVVVPRDPDARRASTEQIVATLTGASREITASLARLVSR
jgi:DNA-binding IclR family transcriptional regulator